MAYNRVRTMSGVIPIRKNAEPRPVRKPVRMLRRKRGSSSWLVPLLMLVASLAYMVGRLSQY